MIAYTLSLSLRNVRFGNTGQHDPPQFSQKEEGTEGCFLYLDGLPDAHALFMLVRVDI